MFGSLCPYIPAPNLTDLIDAARVNPLGSKIGLDGMPIIGASTFMETSAIEWSLDASALPRSMFERLNTRELARLRKGGTGSLDGGSTTEAGAGTSAV